MARKSDRHTLQYRWKQTLVWSVISKSTRSTPAQSLMNCQSSREAHLLRQNACVLTAFSLGMWHESVSPNSYASFDIIVTTLCYMQIFLIRKPLSLRHTHQMMNGTPQALPKMLRSPSAISHVHKCVPQLNHCATNQQPRHSHKGSEKVHCQQLWCLSETQKDDLSTRWQISLLSA